MSPANPATTRTAWGVTWAPLSGFAGPPRPACGGCPWLWVSLKHGASGHPYTSALAACRPGETRVPPNSARGTARLPPPAASGAPLCTQAPPAAAPSVGGGTEARVERGGAPPCRSRPRARGARRSGCTESSGLVWPRGWRGPRPSALDQKRVRRRRAPPAGPGTRSPALPAAPAYGRAATGVERLSQSKRKERERIQAPAPHAPRMLQSLLGPFALTMHLLCPQTRQGGGGTGTRSHLSRHPQRRARCASPVSAAASVCPHVRPCMSVPLSVPPPPLPPGRPRGSPGPATVQPAVRWARGAVALRGGDATC